MQNFEIEVYVFGKCDMIISREEHFDWSSSNPMTVRDTRAECDVRTVKPVRCIQRSNLSGSATDLSCNPKLKCAISVVKISWVCSKRHCVTQLQLHVC
jgi:hypothetical protein